MLYAGIDLHKQFCQCYIEDEHGQQVRSAKIKSEVKEVIPFFDYLPDTVSIAVEACGIKDNLIDELRNKGHKVVVSNPAKNRLIAEAKIKTDKIDAKILADLLRADMLATSYYPPQEIRQLRDLVRHRAYYVKRRTACKNKIHRTLLRNGTKIPYDKPFGKKGLVFLRTNNYPNATFVQQLLHSIDQDTATINILEQQIQETGSTIKQISILRTTYGIDWINATAIWSEIGDITRFKNHKKLVGMSGLIPRIHQSGQTSYAGSITKQGSPILRHALVQATHTCIKQKNHIQSFYLHLVRTKGKKKAIVAAARKLLVSIYYMLKNNQQFIPYCHNMTRQGRPELDGSRVQNARVSDWDRATNCRNVTSVTPSRMNTDGRMCQSP